jgi:hypothetical protein
MNIRGNIIKIQRGQLGWSEITMSDRWSWSRNKVRRFLNWLETKQQIIQQKTAQTSITTIVNYEEYQLPIQQTEQQTIQQKDSRRYTTNKDKKEKKNEDTIVSSNASKRIDLKCKLLLMVFNKWFHKEMVSINSIRSNMEFWDELGIDRMTEGIMHLQGNWPHDYHKITSFLRRTNTKGEPVNHIEDAINAPKREINSDIKEMLENLHNTQEYHEYEQLSLSLCKRV